MTKKFCIVLCLVMLIAALSTASFARKESCSYCGADMECYDVSDEYIVKNYTATCLKYSNRLDIMRKWGTDYFYQCSNPSCEREVFTETETRIERICNH